VSQHMLKVYRLTMDALKRRGILGEAQQNLVAGSQDRFDKAVWGRLQECCNPRWIRGGTDLLKSTVEEMFCKHGGVYVLRVEMPGDEKFSAGLMAWMNTLPSLSADLYSAFRTQLIFEGVVKKADLAKIEVPRVMDAFFSRWEDQPEGRAMADALRKQKNKEIDQLSQAWRSKDKGHEITVRLENKGGVMTSYMVPVRSTCTGVASNLFRMTAKAIEELKRRGMLMASFTTSASLSDRIKSLNAEWRHNSKAMLESTVVDEFCKNGGVFSLFVELPNDQLFASDLLGWMNKLPLNYEERGAFQDTLIGSNKFDLASLATADVEKIMHKVSLASSKGRSVEFNTPLLIESAAASDDTGFLTIGSRKDSAFWARTRPSTTDTFRGVWEFQPVGESLSCVEYGTHVKIRNRFTTDTSGYLSRSRSIRGVGVYTSADQQSWKFALVSEAGTGCLQYGEKVTIQGMEHSGEAGWLRTGALLRNHQETGAGYGAFVADRDGSASFQWKVRRSMYYTSLTACPTNDHIPTKAECMKAHRLLGLKGDGELKIENSATIVGACGLGMWNTFAGVGPTGIVDPLAVCKDQRLQSTMAFEQLLKHQKNIQLTKAQQAQPLSR